MFQRIYQLLVSPFIHLLFGPGSGCRFQPTCSEYCRQAFEKHGFFKGIGLSLWRLLRCQPFSRGGLDPVPKLRSRNEQ